MRVEDFNIREIIAPNLNKTVEVEIKTKKGVVSSPVPLNRNGIYKIRSLPVDDIASKFLEIKRHFVNQAFDNVEDVDNFLKKLDVSVDFREIGGNLAFAISSAFLKSFAQWNDTEVHQYISKQNSMPIPLSLATKGKKPIDIKEFLLYPIQQKSFTESIVKLTRIQKNMDVHGTLEDNLKELSKFSKDGIETGINFEASRIWFDRKYIYTGETLSTQEQLMFVQDIASRYPVGYIEDPFYEDDYILFSTLTHRVPTRLVVGYDIYSNNIDRFKKGVELKTTSGINIKPNRMGTITDVINLVKEAKKNRIKTVISSGFDTNLTAQLAVGLNFDYIKLNLANPLTANELIRIEDRL